jgi:hypothetical protein
LREGKKKNGSRLYAPEEARAGQRVPEQHAHLLAPVQDLQAAHPARAAASAVRRHKVGLHERLILTDDHISRSTNRRSRGERRRRRSSRPQDNILFQHSCGGSGRRRRRPGRQDEIQLQRSCLCLKAHVARIFVIVRLVVVRVGAFNVHRDNTSIATTTSVSISGCMVVQSGHAAGSDDGGGHGTGGIVIIPRRNRRCRRGSLRIISNRFADGRERRDEAAAAEP